MLNGKKYPPVVVVDENDNEIGSAMLAEVWQKGLYHRIVSVFVVDDTGRMLLQLRSPQVKIYPNCWDQAAGGHVDEGFSYEQTAAAEMAEELGLQNVPLTVLGTLRFNKKFDDGRIVNEFERIYVAHVAHDITLRPEPEEVSELRWFTPDELKAKIAEGPKAFTPGTLHCLRKYFPAFAAE
ncbi:MAG TPA: NUDIX domain-containing protein [Candidatus Saccharimonadales bacterium]|jgi:isopentenyl-diphosphate delta-isomerase|nr:NUDIX domain-containing protein [Candidatus Saccharimonadales bacterium]